MIASREWSTSEKAEREFKEWADLLSGDIFVKISIYADESGTHDPEGIEPGSKYPIIAGFAAHRQEWVRFCGRWQVVLNDYKAPYFHFREWSAASAAIRFKKEETPKLRKNPYFGWTLKRLDSFLITLAEIAGEGDKIPIAGAIKIPAFHKIKAALEINNPDKIQMGNDPYKFCLGEFFHVYHKETFLQWGNFDCPVTCFFDQNDKPEWKAAVHEVFDAFKKADPRLGEIVFADKKKKPHFPLQAADMLAYRIRQHAQNIHDDNNCVVEKLDRLLLRNLLTSASINKRIKFHNENPNYRPYSV